MPAFALVSAWSRAGRLLLLACSMSWLAPPVQAGQLDPRILADGFEPTPIAPLFPRVDGVFQLPTNPTTAQLDWLMGEFSAGETTTADEANAHFSATWLAQVPVAQTQAFLQTLRTDYPDAVLDDIVTLTSVRVVAVIRSPVNQRRGFLQLGAAYSGTQRIVQFGVSNYSGSTQYPDDTALTLTQAADKFMTLSNASSLLVARIDSTGQCQASLDRSASTLRATGSVFKIWVLAGLAEAIAQGVTTPDTLVELVAAHIAPSGTINSEPLGTDFSVFDLAVAMLGISDNTATDLLHEHVGRLAIDQAVTDAGVDDPTVLQPLLKINEQFHLFHSFDLATSQGYVDDSEAFQLQFANGTLASKGPLTAYPYFHVGLLTAGSWRASPRDICATYAHLRSFDGDAARTIDSALGASAGQPGVRGRWDRVWYKGGSLGSGAGLHVLAHAWMLERTGEDPIVLVAMSNANAGGIDQFKVQSVLGRMLQVLAAMP